jgi:hypothetical protein
MLEVQFESIGTCYEQNLKLARFLFLDINELPPQMGLLSRLWNLNTRGCSLQDPLKSMIDSKKYKTMDIVGYLKSVLEDARPYARMKLMIVGVQGIGKTSLLEQLRQEGITRRRPEVKLFS